MFASSYDEGHVFRYDGERWTDCGQVGEEANTQTCSFAVYAGKLHVGTWRTGKVDRYLADNQWEDTGRLGKELKVMGMMVHNGQLFAGTLPLAELNRFDGLDGLGLWRQVGRVDLTPDVKYRRAWTMAEYAGPGDFFNGRLSDVRPYRRALSDAEIARLALAPAR